VFCCEGLVAARKRHTDSSLSCNGHHHNTPASYWPGLPLTLPHSDLCCLFTTHLARLWSGTTTLCTASSPWPRSHARLPVAGLRSIRRPACTQAQRQHVLTFMTVIVATVREEANTRHTKRMRAQVCQRHPMQKLKSTLASLNLGMCLCECALAQAWTSLRVCACLRVRPSHACWKVMQKCSPIEERMISASSSSALTPWRRGEPCVIWRLSFLSPP